MKDPVEALNECGPFKWSKSALYEEQLSEGGPLYYVYRIYRPDTGKSYVGFSFNPNHRLSCHINASLNEKDPSHKTKFKKSLRKNGIQGFVTEILFVSSSKELSLEKEKEFIARYNSYKNGYNSTIGGEGHAHEELTCDFIVERAREFSAKNGCPPSVLSGDVEGGFDGDSWAGYNICLAKGYRGLPKSGSLATLLNERCGYVYQFHKPDLTYEYVLEMAEKHKERTGKWPGQKTGPIVDGHEGDTWAQYERLLCDGGRGLPGGSSLAKLINTKHNHVHDKNKAPVTEDFIVERAKEFFAKNDRYPRIKEGPVEGGHPGDTWNGYDRALYEGLRGLPGGTSLFELLSTRLGAKNHLNKPRLSEDFIVERAREYLASTGKRPTLNSGPVTGGNDGDTWKAYEMALRLGLRGLPGNSSLSKLLKSRL